ncbi:MAG: YggS family pyridoxal phosphate-dependent enzyme [Phycisphaerales bacterium JB065]
MTALMSLESRYREVMDKVASAAQRSGRRPGEVLVVAVSKYAEMDQVRELYRLGHRDFGESRVQQLVQRAAMMDEWQSREQVMPNIGEEQEMELFASSPEVGHESRLPRARWHMIGHLQRNKARKCVEVARLIHSVDTLRLVDEIHAVAFKMDKEVELLVQVNCTGEKQKYGCAVAAAEHIAEQIDSLVHLKVRGLMAMGPTSMDPGETRATFERTKELFDEMVKLQLCDGRFNILSMGMSHDYEMAIECGANMVRVGSAIFGENERGDHEEDGEE